MFICRDNNFFHVPDLIFPFRKDMDELQENTLLDGELVIDEVPIPVNDLLLQAATSNDRKGQGEKSLLMGRREMRRAIL